jgi:hypothetical protein
MRAADLAVDLLGFAVAIAIAIGAPLGAETIRYALGG